ncbi:hypothetical protein niasHT_025987 [Heterodera trifolii]|uniref:Golgi apparatus protein 1 n=1 Tax=Heterodera trifolii TaxID=157864 RepID=A0ABD2JA85_9BILA
MATKGQNETDHLLSEVVPLTPAHWRQRRVRCADDGTAEDTHNGTVESNVIGGYGGAALSRASPGHRCIGGGAACDVRTTALPTSSAPKVKPQRREMKHYLQQKFEQKEFKERHGRFLFVQEFRQSEDKTVPALLFIAFRIDREIFCVQIAAGEGKVFHCPMEYKQQDEKMATLCLKVLSERAELMGRDYTLAHPLLKSCDNELQAYRCVPQPGFEKSLKFDLSWMVLCLENGLHYFKTQEHERKKAEEDKNAKQRQWPNLLAFTDECQLEMMTHRQMMVKKLRMSPEIVMGCAQEIDKYCSPQGDIESEGKTVHCLMAHAQERDEKKVLTQQCKNALQELVKVADIGSNFKVDKVLYDSCKPVIESKCKMDAASEANTLSCLMRNLDEPEMTDECEQRLVEVQYFMSRDWSLDPQLYEACHQEAVTRCHATDNWHENTNKLPGQDQKVVRDTGPQGDIESEGKTVHCLMAHAQEWDEEKVKFFMAPVDSQLNEACRQEAVTADNWHKSANKLRGHAQEGVKKVLTQQCKNALQKLVKLADIGSNFKVDKAAIIIIVMLFLLLLFAASVEAGVANEVDMPTSENTTATEIGIKNSDGTEGTDHADHHKSSPEAVPAAEEGMSAETVAWISGGGAALGGLILCVLCCVCVRCAISRKNKTKEEEVEPTSAAAAKLSFLEELRHAVSFRRKTLTDKGLYV